MYLRCLTGDRPRTWLEWLSWAEYCYNTSYHSALRATPFEVVYGRAPPVLLPYKTGTAWTDTVDKLLTDRDTFLAEVRDRLLQAQEYAKRHYDARHRALQFKVDDWVLLRLLNRPAQSLLPGVRGKLSPAMQARFRLWNAWARSPIACVCQREPGSMTFFISAFSSPSRAPLLCLHRCCPMSTPVLPPLHNGRRLHRPERALRS